MSSQISTDKIILNEGFVYAAKEGDLKKVNELLDNGADADYSDIDNGSTAIMHAAQKGHVEVVKLLLNKMTVKGFKTLNKDKLNLIAYALEGSSGEKLELIETIFNFLTKNIPDLETIFSKECMEYSLLRSAKIGFTQLVKFLLTKTNCNIHTIKNDKGLTATYLAADSGKIDTLNAIFTLKPMAISHKANDGSNLLFAALGNSQIKTAEYLLKASEGTLKLDAKTSDGDTILMRSCQSLESIKWLLERPEIQDSKMLFATDHLGLTVIHRAAAYESIEVLKYIFKINPFAFDVVTQINKDGVSPLYLAASNGKLEAVKVLLELHPKSLHEVNKLGGNPVIVAASCNHLETLEYLLSKIEGIEKIEYIKDLLFGCAKIGAMKVVESIAKYYTFNLFLTNKFGQSIVNVTPEQFHINLIICAIISIETAEERYLNKKSHKAQSDKTENKENKADESSAKSKDGIPFWKLSYGYPISKSGDSDKQGTGFNKRKFKIKVKTGWFN